MGFCTAHAAYDQADMVVSPLRRQRALLQPAKEPIDGKAIRVTDWVTIDQQRIDKFAEATGDFQWIHVDVERAKGTPYGGGYGRSAIGRPL